MPGKAQAPAALPTLNAESIEKMIQAVKLQESRPAAPPPGEAGGQPVNPDYAARPLPTPGALARPMGPESQEPAIPQGPAVQPAPPVAPVATPSVYPGMTPGQPDSLAAEVKAVSDQLAEMRAQWERDAERKRQEDAEARFAAIEDPAQRAEAKAEHYKSQAMAADVKLAAQELRATHPMFVDWMEALSTSGAEIELDAIGYRALATKTEPFFQALVDQRVVAKEKSLEQAVQEQWGVRPKPEDITPPPPDHPAITAYRKAREALHLRPTDADIMQQFIVAGTALRRLGLDGRQIV